MRKSVASGKLVAFPGAPECHVLDDGLHIITQRGVVATLTAKNGREDCGAEGGKLARYLAKLPNEYSHLVAGAKHSIPFITLDGKNDIGCDSEWFVELCYAYIALAMDGKLSEEQEPLAVNAIRIMRSVTSYDGICREPSMAMHPN